MGINLKSYVFNSQKVDYSSADIIRRMDEKLASEKYQKKTGLVTSGFVEAVLEGSTPSWAVSDIILFPYQYSERPVFTWGLEGTYSGETSNPSPYASTGDNYYSLELPSPLTDYMSIEDFTTFSPAIFIPRVVHWYKKTPLTWSGCYILLYQMNPNCTELDGKICRVHFKFEGAGYL